MVFGWKLRVECKNVNVRIIVSGLLSHVEFIWDFYFGSQYSTGDFLSTNKRKEMDFKDDKL